MLPDLDSDSGVPVRETVSFAAALIPMLMISRFQSMGLTHESIAVAGLITYLLVRFGVAAIFKRYTVHRGMWHSIPAAASAGLIAFLACSSEDLNSRYFKSAAVVLGFMSHLVLDEIWSVTVRGVVPRFKKSFGTAMKFWGDDRWANVSTYAKLLVLSVMATGDPVIMNWMGYQNEGLPQFAQKWVDDLRAKSQDVVRQAEEVIGRPEELQRTATAAATTAVATASHRFQRLAGPALNVRPRAASGERRRLKWVLASHRRHAPNSSSFGVSWVPPAG